VYCPHSLQSINKHVRHSVAKDLVDLDIVNCHPTLFQLLCKKNNIDCPYIDEYVSNRDIIIDKLENEYNTIKAKTTILSIMYGCQRKQEWCDWLQGLYTEVHKVMSIIDVIAPESFKLAQRLKKPNLKGSALSYELCKMERKKLDIMIKYCKVNKIKVSTLCHDGLMLYKEDLMDYDILAARFTEEIGMNVIVKPMDSFINPDYYVNTEISINNLIEKGDMRESDEYFQMKRDFETNHFKLRNPFGFAEIDYNEDVVVRKEKECEGLYRNMLYEGLDGDKKSFFSTWVHDESIRTYEKLVFDPRRTNPEYTYNTYRGLAIDRHVCDDYDEEEGQKGLDVFLKHIYYLAGENEQVKEYIIKWMAYIVQKPGVKTQVAFVFKSDEGMGKTGWADFFADCVIGEEQSVSDNNVNHFVGGFNGLKANKIFVALDESNSKDTFLNREEIKKWITDAKSVIEKKHKDSVKDDDFANIVFLTNLVSSVSIGPSDRRFMVVQCSDKYTDDSVLSTPEERTDYRNTLFKYIDNKNPCPHFLQKFKEYIYSVDISNFVPQRDRVITDAYKTLKINSMPVVLKFIKDFQDDPVHTRYSSQTREKMIVEKVKDLYDEYKLWSTRYNASEAMSKTTFTTHMINYSKKGVLKAVTIRGFHCYKWKFNEFDKYLISKKLLIVDEKNEDETTDPDLLGFL